MANLSFSGKWSDLLAALQLLNKEQLARDIVVVDDNGHTFMDVSLEITTEKHYEPDAHEPYQAESELRGEGFGDAELAECSVEQAGAVYLQLG